MAAPASLGGWVAECLNFWWQRTSELLSCDLGGRNRGPRGSGSSAAPPTKQFQVAVPRLQEQVVAGEDGAPQQLTGDWEPAPLCPQGQWPSSLRQGKRTSMSRGRAYTPNSMSGVTVTGPVSATRYTHALCPSRQLLCELLLQPGPISRLWLCREPQRWQLCKR